MTLNILSALVLLSVRIFITLRWKGQYFCFSSFVISCSGAPILLSNLAFVLACSLIFAQKGHFLESSPTSISITSMGGWGGGVILRVSKVRLCHGCHLFVDCGIIGGGVSCECLERVG